LIVGLFLAGFAYSQVPEPTPPPPPPVEEAEAPKKAPDPPPLWKSIDWTDRSNQLMLALGIGAVVLAKVIFRKMQE
jgi:hypothetical protein